MQECADGSLVLLHDLSLSRAFPLQAAVNAGGVAMIEAATGLSLEAAAVQDLTLAQLQLLALGGRRGVHAPTLRQFLEACVACDIARPLAIEVKLLLTDAARGQLLDDVRCCYGTGGT